MGRYAEDPYELRVSRRDGRTIRHDREPRPVVEQLDIKDMRQVEETVGKHFPWMAAAAEGKEIHARMRLRQMQDWLGEYQCEVWRTWGNPREPELTSTSTKGWE